MTMDKKADKMLLDMRDDHKQLLLDILRANIPELEVWAFGSRAKWTAREASDLDLVLRNFPEPEKAIDLEIISNLKEIFDESDLPFMVDILDWATVSGKFRQVIEREYVVVQRPGKKGWKRTTLDEIAEIIMGQSPSGENCNETGNGVPLLNGSTEFGGYHPTPVQFTTDPKKIAEVGDILFCVRGSTTGKMNWADQRYAIGRGLAAIRYKKGKELQPFLKGIIEYYLPNLLAEATESTFPNVSSQQLNKLEIDIPESREIQTRIASILSTLDDKIELNRQTNATLEAIAQAIFKEWFVKFRFPGADGEMEESELGLIPKGWRVGRLGEVCRNIRKIANPKEIDSKIFYVGLEHIPRKSLGLDSWGLSEDVESQKSYFKKYNILFGKLRPYFHKVCIAPFDGICSTDILVIEPIQNQCFSFCLNHLFSDKLIAYVSTIADGTRMPHVDWNSISNYQVVIPPECLLSKFNEITWPIYDEIIENNQQSTTLAQIRDSLLPKLMNGEIEV